MIGNGCGKRGEKNWKNGMKECWNDGLVDGGRWDDGKGKMKDGRDL